MQRMLRTDRATAKSSKPFLIVPKSSMLSRSSQQELSPMLRRSYSLIQCVVPRGVSIRHSWLRSLKGGELIPLFSTFLDMSMWGRRATSIWFKESSWCLTRNLTDLMTLVEKGKQSPDTRRQPLGGQGVTAEGCLVREWREPIPMHESAIRMRRMTSELQRHNRGLKSVIATSLACH